MNYDIVILSIIFIPVIGAFILPLIGGRSKTLRNVLAFVFLASSFLLSLCLIPASISGHAPSFTANLALGFNLNFLADGLAVFMACVSSLISAVIILFSWGYIDHYDNQDEYYTMVVLFCGSMMGLVYSNNLIFLYAFWEITALLRCGSSEICPPYDTGRGGAADCAGGANRRGSSRVASTFSSVCRML